jgi:integrase/recombinase XerC
MLEEVTRQIDGTPKQRLKAVRDRAILRLLFDLALRRSSVTSLNLEDVDLEARTIEVWVKGADNRERKKRSLPRLTAEALREWVNLRGNQPGALFIALDPNSKGRRLTGTSIWRIANNIAESIGEKAWPHAIRHSSITEVVDQSRDVRLGRIQAGHGSISTTQRYLDNLESRELDREASGIAARALG